MWTGLLSLHYLTLLWPKFLVLPFFLFYWQYEGIWTQFSRCRGGAWWPVAFSNLLKKQHSRGYSMLMLPLADMIAASVLLFYPRAQYQPGTVWKEPTELPKYRGGVCRVASCVFKTACIEEHFRGYSHASLAEVLAASALLFYWQGQYERDNVDRALNVEVVLGRGEFQGLSMSILNASTSLHTTVCRTFGSIHRTFGSIRRIISDELWLHLPCRTFGSICRTFAPYAALFGSVCHL